MGSHTDFRKNISEKANYVIGNFLPACIRQLDDLLRTESLKNENIENVQRCSNMCIQEIATSQREGDKDGRRHVRDYESNKVIVNLVQTLKPIIFDLLEAINTLRLWILLLIPEVADGNNFGVEVQESVLSEFRESESEINEIYTQAVSYFLSRGEIMSRAGKFPRIFDYVKYIAEEDDNQFAALRLAVAQLRNISSSLLNTINRNIDKITLPRSSTSVEALF